MERKDSTAAVNERLKYLWLIYFNDSLFAQGLITEEERNQMAVKIASEQMFV